MKRETNYQLFNSIAVVFIILILKPDILSAQVFTKVNVPAISNSKANGFGCGFFDFDNDGKLDIFVTNYGSKNQVFRNEGNDSFFEVNVPNLIPSSASNSGLSLGDYDNDGKNDLYLISISGTGSLINKTGDSTYSLVDNHPMTKLSGFLIHNTWIDYDNDGLIDLFVPACINSDFKKGPGIKNYLFHNEGYGEFSPVNNSAPEMVAGNNVCANFCDIDNDGDMDLFMTDCQVDNHLFENVNGIFTEINKGDFPNDYSSISCSWGDYDNDGYMDLFVANGLPREGGDYPTYLYHNNGNKTFTKITTGELAEYRGNSWNGLWADFDNDGDLDLFVGTYSQPDVLFINNGDGTFTRDNEFDMSSKGTSGACFGDYNDDGFLDLFTANNYGTGHLLYKNKGNSNNWIFIDCEGTISNRSAIGARVKIKATIFGKSYWQVRQINSNMGFRSVCELKAHFGLGDATVIDSLVIEWPSKQITVKTGIPVNQIIKVKEDTPVNYLEPRFKIDVKSGYSPLKIQFTDLSVCNENTPITSWSWDFDGDGKEDSNEKNPARTFYSYDGKIYNVSLTVSTGIADKKITKDSLINIFPLCQQNVALQKKVEVSSTASRPVTIAASIIDGTPITYWQSAIADSQWVKIELDSSYAIGKIVIKWGSYYATQYKLQYSNEGKNWLDLFNNDNGKGGTDTINIKTTHIKYIKLLLNLRASGAGGFNIKEFEMYRPKSLNDTTTDVNETKVSVVGYNLFQNYPNPFNPETIISYQLPVKSQVILKVYDMLGCEVALLINRVQNAGNYEVKFNGSKLASGIYIYKLTADNFTAARKLVLIK